MSNDKHLMNGMVESNLFPDTIYLFIEYIYSTFAEAIDANVGM